MTSRSRHPFRLFTVLAALAAAMSPGSPASADAGTDGVASGRVDPRPQPPDVGGPWESHVVDLADRVETPVGPGPLRVHYLAAGPRDAPRVVLLHGFPDFSYSWRELIPALAADFRVIAPDLRGYAGTGKPRTGYDRETLAGDVIALLDATAADDGLDPDVVVPVHLVGHDWGAAVAWTVARIAPERLYSLTVLSVPHPAVMERFQREVPEQRRRSRYMRLLATPGAAGVLAGYGPERRARLYRDGLLRAAGFDDDDLARYQAAFDHPDEVRGPLAYYRTLLRERRGTRGEPLDETPVHVPTLVLWGAHDAYLMPEMAAPSCALVTPQPCEVEVLPQAGHFVHWDDPDAVVARWRRFVDTHLGSGP